MSIVRDVLLNWYRILIDIINFENSIFIIKHHAMEEIFFNYECYTGLTKSLSYEILSSFLLIKLIFLLIKLKYSSEYYP